MKQIALLDITSVCPILQLYEIISGFLFSLAIIIASKLDKEPAKDYTVFDSVKHSDI